MCEVILGLVTDATASKNHPNEPEKSFRCFAQFISIFFQEHFFRTKPLAEG